MLAKTYIAPDTAYDISNFSGGMGNTEGKRLTVN